MMANTMHLWKQFQKDLYKIYLLHDTAQTHKAALSQIQAELVTPHIGILSLAERFVELDIIEEKYMDDCINIASALVLECDFFVSWNYKSIVNTKTIRGTKIIAMLEDYKDIIICTPTMVSAMKQA